MPELPKHCKAIKILLKLDEPVKKLWENVDYLRAGFKKLGFDMGHSESPIIPVMLGDEDSQKLFSAKLFEEDVFATPIIFPMVAKGKARIRVFPRLLIQRKIWTKDYKPSKKWQKIKVL